MFARLSSRLAMRRSVSKRSECLRAARAWAERSQGTAEEQLHGDFGGAGGVNGHGKVMTRASSHLCYRVHIRARPMEGQP